MKPRKPIKRTPLKRSQTTIQRTPLKRSRTAIPNSTKKRAAENRLYLKRRAEWLPGRICPVTKDPATEIHHKNGRRGKLLLDESGWIGVSAAGHKWIHSYLNSFGLLITKALVKGCDAVNTIAPFGFINFSYRFHKSSNGIIVSHLQAVVP